MKKLISKKTLIFKNNDNGKYEVYFNHKNFYYLNTNLILEKLKNKNIKMLRFCLHSHENEMLQESIIATKGYRYFRPHKHSTGKNKTYHLLKGEILIVIFDNKGKVKKRVILSDKKNGNIIFRLKSNTYSNLIPITRTSIWHEVCIGPFSKGKKFLTYLKNSPSIDSNRRECLDYSSKVSKVDLKRRFKE